VVNPIPNPTHYPGKFTWQPLGTHRFIGHTKGSWISALSVGFAS